MKISIYEIAKCLVLAMAINVSDAQAWTERAEFKGVEVLVSDNHVALICGTYDIPAAIANPVTKQILINKPFTLLARRVQIAVLYHEYGHLKLGHRTNIFDLIKRIRGNMDNKQMQYELEADLYAAKHGYAKELRLYLRLINEYIFYEPVPELTERIKALKEFQNVQKNDL